MGAPKGEEELLRSVALENAQSIFLARQRAEEELVRTKERLERKTHELAHSLAMMRATLESTTDGILVTDGHGKVTDFNEQFVALWRLSREALDTRDLRHLLTVMSRSCTEPRQFLARMDDIHASAPLETYDVLECTDGRVFERSSRIQFVEGRNVGRVWSFRDITERRHAEEARLRLAAIVESSDDAIISKSLAGVITSWNAAAERLFGYRAEEIVGQSILRLLPEDRHAEEHEILERLRRGERVDPFETVRRTKGGRLLEVSVTTSPLRDERGTIIGASKIARDITARKQMEAALARAHADLRQVAYVSAHDLQEPVRQLGLYTQRLALRYRDAADAGTREAMDFIVEGTKRMQAQFTDLLNYLEIEGPGAGITTTDCELLLWNVRDALRAAIAASGATVTHGPLPTLAANAPQLQLVFHELIDNAVKFRDSAPPHVHVWAERTVGGWRFAVRDAGIGIDLQSAGQLFGFFKRLARDRYPGTGMGLAVCKKIVERHGGRIWLTPTPGGGLTVIFTISDIKEGGSRDW